MASITQKPNGTYLIRISCGTDAAGKPVSKSKIFKPSRPNLTYQKLNREIDAFIKAFEEEISLYGIDRKPDKIRFAEFCKTYLDVKKNSLSPNTFQFYERIITDTLVPMFGTLWLKDIRTYHVQQFIQYLTNDRPRGDGKDGTLSAATVKRYTTVLRSVLTLAYNMEYIEEDIGSVKRLIFPKIVTKEIDVYTIDEVNEMLSAAKTEPLHIRALIEVALFTGLRRAEIVGLKWNDIDFDERCLSVRRSIYKLKSTKANEKDTKSDYSKRIIAIPERLCETLKEYRIHQDRHASFLGSAWKNLGYIFTEEYGHVMNPHTPTKQFSNFLKRHGIRHLKLHGLRHTSATMLLASGCDIKTVSVRLGHADIETTNIYVHALESTDRRAADTFDKICSNKQ